MIYPPTRLNSNLMEAIIAPGTTDWVAFGNNIGIPNDLGATWQVSVIDTLPYRPPVHPTMVAVYWDVEFVSASSAFFSSRNELLKTMNAGGSWDSVMTIDPVNPNYSGSGNLGALHFPTPDVGYAVGNFSKILKTTDGGETWITLQSNPSTAPYRTYSDVRFLNEQVGFVAGYEVATLSMNFAFDEQVMKTTDGGMTWEITSVPGLGDFRAQPAAHQRADGVPSRHWRPGLRAGLRDGRQRPELVGDTGGLVEDRSDALVRHRVRDTVWVQRSPTARLENDTNRKPGANLG